MTRENYFEIKPGRKILKKLYLTVMFWFVGRAIQATARTDREIKEEFNNLREDFIGRLRVLPSGPQLTVGKEKTGRIKTITGNRENVTLDIQIKNLEAAMLMFTFRESTTLASSRTRLIVNGDIRDVCAFIRVLDRVEVYLLPKIIAKLAVRRYPDWSRLCPLKKHFWRFIIYFRTITGI